MTLASGNPLRPIDARRFGLGVLLTAAALATWLALRKHSPRAALALVACGAGTQLLAFIAPKTVLRLRAAWMGLAVAVGWINSRILLSAIFFLMVTPLALVLRVFGKRPLDLGIRDRASYWITPRRRDARHHDHPF